MKPATPGSHSLAIGVPTELSFLLSLNTVVGLLFTFIGDWGPWWQNLVISHVIGGTIWLAGRVLRSRLQPEPPLLILLTVPPGIGVIVGLLAVILFGMTGGLGQKADSWQIVAANLIAATAAAAVFVLFYQWSSLKMEINERRRRDSEAREAETRSRLALLQAQIEPHFLFNTLANVRSLISRDPDLAQQMLDHFNDYLRISLSRTRRLRAPFSEELSLIEALLSIARIRLGDRITYNIVAPESLCSISLPPLIIQPLVENAIRHGIEPSVAGGEITVIASEADDILVVSVIDTGVGMDHPVTPGVGLTNIRDRLEGLYGQRAKLSLDHNEPRGVVATLSLPIER